MYHFYDVIIVTLHGEIDCDVTSVCTDAGDDPDRVVIDGAPLVLRRRHARLDSNPIPDLMHDF